MEVCVDVAGSAVGFIATDNSVYATLALLNAAGKHAFPYQEQNGMFPSSLVVTVEAAGGVSTGSGVVYSVNAQDSPVPTNGIRVWGAGQQFVLPGVDGIHLHPISNVYQVSADVSGDIVHYVAVYDA